MGEENTKLLLLELKEIKKDLQVLNHLLTGNGSPERGLIVRVDRLEQHHARNKWTMRTTVGAAIAAVVALVIEKMKP